MAPSGKTKELRLALVCYGGSSLAIYMHGVTKEIHRLIRGSALLEQGSVGAGSQTEQAYAALLKELAEKTGVRTRVVVDIVAGTSAGGINGICLAKAIAHNRSLDALRELWFDHGDIKGLLNAPRLRFLGRLALPVRVGWIVARGREPLRGAEMCQWLYQAFADMDQGHPDPPTLMPDQHRLQLFVTITDFYGYERQIPFTDPNPIRDRRHRHVLEFRHGDGDDDFGSEDNATLTFAARTTSCIPGVFPPVSFSELEKWLPGKVDVERLRRKFRLYTLAGAKPEATWFVDGGVLDNKPFGYAVTAIRSRPADLEVTRRLVYIEPDPSDPTKPRDESKTRPNVFAAAVGGLIGLPRAEPILDDLVAVADQNERVDRIAQIIETNWKPIGQVVDEIAGGLGTIPTDPNSPELAEIDRRMHEQAATGAGFSYATYSRLKIASALDRYADTAAAVCDLPSDSNHALLTRAVVREWANGRQLYEPGPKHPLPSDIQLAFLRTFDLGYGERRLRFVIDGVSGWYDCAGQKGYPSREQLDKAKKSLYDALGTLHAALDAKGFDDTVNTSFSKCFALDAMTEFLLLPEFKPADYVTRFSAELAKLEADLGTFLERKLKSFRTDLYNTMQTVTADWDEPRRRALLVRYLGFPFWDVLLFPVQALSDVGERDDVKVMRMSPLDTARIPPMGPGKKLIGATKGHFGAFLSDRGGRERDYLWGRLDAAERLVRILLEQGKRSQKGWEPASPEDRKRWEDTIIRAILDEDAVHVPHADDLVQHVRRETAETPA